MAVNDNHHRFRRLKASIALLTEFQPWYGCEHIRSKVKRKGV
jgi:hypothetical protein